ncbi:hypothetical protein WJ03_10530 [Burkholderia vietnamiensis]|nr:hypothetical protein WJ03_10530 [Burkholderia vietnamiensis]
MFAETTVQTCIVRLIRDSLDFASWKDRRSVAAALKNYPPIAALWRGPGIRSQFTLLYRERFNLEV